MIRKILYVVTCLFLLYVYISYISFNSYSYEIVMLFTFESVLSRSNYVHTQKPLKKIKLYFKFCQYETVSKIDFCNTISDQRLGNPRGIINI